MQEIWKDITGYEGKYQVSNLGRVKSIKRNTILKPNISRGYLRVELRKPGIRDERFIHRLIAEAFIPNPNNYDTIHHKDFNKLNNSIDNLIWLSNSEHVALHNKTKNNGKAVRCIETGICYKSAIEAERQIKCTTIHKMLQGRCETAAGYHWEYI